MVLPPLRTRPLERERPARLEGPPPLGQVVEPREERRLERALAPAALELRNERLRPATLGHPHALDPVPAPDLDRLLPVDGDEQLRRPAGGERPEDPVVEAQLRLGDEVQHVVRKPVAVPGRRPREEVGGPVAAHVDAVVALALRERDAHQPLRFSLPWRFAYRSPQRKIARQSGIEAIAISSKG